ncbi:VWA domain-containing protein [Novosphingobium sp.]|uniref:vWA domain-containing protein n=1 Tax=Novosphingobium sp. TaxID=1874826 RepID=UPI002735E832|nr:vWA domain-containing protein [Novosphingobium sp.]MDP3907474.1 VWA domain-containing protein [Novosphingobium sp.]
MRKGLSLIAMMAVLVHGPAMAAPPSPPPPAKPGASTVYGPDRAQGLCRKPAALPLLDAETQVRPPRPVRPKVGGGRAYPSAPVAMEAPGSPVPAPPPPPPPPPPAAMASGAGSGDVIVSGTPVDSARVADATPAYRDEPRSSAAKEAAKVMPPRPYPRPRPQPQAGQLTAGEHDDLLNPELYADYVRRSDLGQAIPDLPRVDTQRTLTVAVNDRAGRPVPFAGVELACADGGRITLATTADGKAVFFPEVDQLGRDVWVRTRGEAWRAVSIPARRGAQRVDFTVDRTAPAVRKLDLMLVIDTTGSMGDEIRYLQSELAAIIDGVRARHPQLDLRLGFVFYRDFGDDYVTQTVPLSADVAAGQAALRRQGASGGGDYPEAMDQALIRAAGQAWRADAAKTMLLVADAPPHDRNFGKTWLAAEHLRASRVHIVPVAASGVADKAEYVMRAMAAATQSRYTFLTDDSGIGNPHAPPAIDCYQVTRLDALIRRVIDSQISGRRIEPAEQEVIRTVGQQDGGRCIIPRDFGNQ